MKIIKRGQLAILSISFMIMIAGYINYKYDGEREKDLGKTVYVNGNEILTYSSNEVKPYKETDSKDAKLYDKKVLETMAQFKSSKDSYFSELETSYKSAIENSLLTSEQIKIYQDKLNDLVTKKHLLSTIENLIKAKNIEDIVIVPTGDNFNVVVKVKEKLKDSDRAIIEIIIKDELKIDSKKITITEIGNEKENTN